MTHVAICTTRTAQDSRVTKRGVLKKLKLNKAFTCYMGRSSQIVHEPVGPFMGFHPVTVASGQDMAIFVT